MDEDCVRCGRPRSEHDDDIEHDWTDDGAPTGYEGWSPAEIEADRKGRHRS